MLRGDVSIERIPGAHGAQGASDAVSASNAASASRPGTGEHLRRAGPEVVGPVAEVSRRIRRGEALPANDLAAR